tara:strand:- start:477 stop:983 length:507 start_codon:yes stop_codon:yes gene_type:complete
MILGVALTPKGWLAVLFTALIAMLAPLVAIEAIANNFSDPWRMAIVLLGSYVLWPAAVAWIYKLKLRKSGKGSMIFYFYVGFYFLMFLAFLSKAFSGESSWNDYLGVVVLGAVSSSLIWFALNTRRKNSDNIARSQADRYEVERSKAIRRQAEAILLAEEMKKQKNQT